MINSLIESTQINLSDQVIKEIVLDVMVTAQQLGLSINDSNLLHHIEETGIVELIKQYNSFDLPPLSDPDTQGWR